MKYLYLGVLFFISFAGFSQINKMEAYQMGTKLAFYPDQCGNTIPQGQGKLSFCDYAGNLGVVERSYGLSGRGVIRMFKNHQNQDEVYLTSDGISIRNQDGTWENVPHIAAPYSGSSPTLSVNITDGLITPSGKMIFSSTNSQSTMSIYDRSTKTMTTEFFPQNVYPYLFVYDSDRSVTWVLTVKSSDIHLYQYDENTLTKVAEFDPGFSIQAGNPIAYRADHIYIGRPNGLYDINVANTPFYKHYSSTSTPNLPLDGVSDFQFDVNGTLWMAMRDNYDSGVVKFNPVDGSSQFYQLPLESNPIIDHRFEAIAVDDSGIIWTTGSNYNGLMRITFDGNVPTFTTLAKDSISALGFPFTYVPSHIYFRNDQFYFTTHDGSSGTNKNYEVIIKKDDVWSGRNDDADGNLSYNMHRRFNLSEPDDVGGVWWLNSPDDIIVYRDADGNHKSVDVNTGYSYLTVDTDQKAIFHGGSPSGLQKVDFPNVVAYQQDYLDVSGIQRVGDQVWVYNRGEKKVDVFENNNLVNSYNLDNDDFQYYYYFSVDDENNVWFMRTNGTGGIFVRKLDTKTLELTTYDRDEKLGVLRKIVAGPNNSIWFVGKGGLLLYQDNNWYSLLSEDYPELWKIVDAVMDVNNKLHVLRNTYAAIITIENATTNSPTLYSIPIEKTGSILPSLDHYGPQTITIDSEGSIWTHASQNAFKLIDDDLAREYRVSKVVRNQGVNYDLDVEIYPNPSNGHIAVLSDLTIDKIDVYNVLGEKLVSSVRSNTIDVNLPSGMYVVRIYVGEKVAVRKIVIE